MTETPPPAPPEASPPEAPPPARRRSAPGSTRRTLIIAVVVVVLLIVAGGLWLAYRPAHDQIQGMVDADQVNVSGKITGRVARLLVREGDRVQAGQVLYLIDSPEVAAKEQQARGALQSAEALSDKAQAGARPEEVRAAEAQWRRAQAAADLAQTTYRRLDNLYSEGVIARQKRDEALANAKASTEASNAARAQYDMARVGARPEDKAAAGGQRAQAQGAVAEVEAAKAETEIRAPVAAEVSKRLIDLGELAPAGYPVFTLVDVANPWVAINLREDQFRGLKVGAVIKGDVPALGTKAVAFKVYFIAPAGDYATWRATRQSSGYDVKSFEVRLRPVSAQTALRPGMSVLFDWPQ